MTLTWDDTDLGVGQDLYRVDANTGEQVLLTASVANGEGYSNPVGDYAPAKQRACRKLWRGPQDGRDRP